MRPIASKAAEALLILPPMKIAEIHTAKGLLKAELYEKETPKTVQNFVDLSNKGFYNGLNFHRVLPGFVIQGGCPEGTGRGGPGYRIPCETFAEKQFHDRGVLSMAHAGPNTGGSQFFIVLTRQATAHLDRQHTCFGKVFEGLEFLDDIKQGDKINKIVIVEQ
jgi:peptidyl-prolyl cis-trans isomerase B (cyclophilin B)